MSARATRRLLAAAGLVAWLALGSPDARAVDTCGGETTLISDCGVSNFCICCDGTCGNAVWHAWWAACKFWGHGPEWCSNAQNWNDDAASHGYLTGSTPAASSIFVCEGGSPGCSSVGTVGWVVAVNPDGTLSTTEQYCGGTCGTHSLTRAASYATGGFIYGPGSADVDSSSLVSETIPDNTHFQPGAAFTKRWVLLNNGSSTWTPGGGYTFAFDGETQMGAAAQTALAAGVSVVPGGSYTFDVPMTAPVTPGTYRGYFRMDHSGVRFGVRVWVQIVVDAPTPDAPPPPVDDASFVSSSVPDGSRFAPNEAFVAEIRMRNTGDTTWTRASSYVFAYVSGDQLSAPIQTLLPAGTTVAPGAEHTFSLSMRAPLFAGTYTGVFQMKHVGFDLFGDQVPVQIVVELPPDGAPPPDAVRPADAAQPTDGAASPDAASGPDSPPQPDGTVQPPDGPAASDAATDAAAPPADSSGTTCGCATPGRGRRPAGLAVAVLALLALGILARRARPMDRAGRSLRITSA